MHKEKKVEILAEIGSDRDAVITAGELSDISMGMSERLRQSGVIVTQDKDGKMVIEFEPQRSFGLVPRE
jgi:hypothetical protein